MKISFLTSKLLWIVFIAILITALLIYSRNLASYAHYHMDEGYWIETSKWTFSKFVLEKDFSASQWTSWRLRTFGRTNPNAAKLLIGGILYLNGYGDFRGLPAWDMSKSKQWNIENGNAAAMDELRVARWPIVVMTAFAAGLLFMGFSLSTSDLLRGIVGGIVSAIVFLTHPLVYTLGRQVMLDIPAIFFSIISVMCAWRVITDHDTPSLGANKKLWGLLASIFSGIAVSTKLNAGIMLVLTVIVGLYALFSSKTNKDRLFWIFVLLLPPVIFLALNPQLWPDIGKGIRVMLEFGKSIAARRERFPDAALWTVTDRLQAFYIWVFGKPLELLLFSFGVIILVKNWRTLWPILVWGSLSIFAVLYWTPLNWNRYYLPAVPFYAFAIGYLLANRISFESDPFRREKP